MTTNQTKAVLNMACDNIFDINYISKYYNNLGEKKLFKNFIKEFNSKIVAAIKPYFMIYIYPNLKSKMQSYVKNMNLEDMPEDIQKLYKNTHFYEEKNNRQN